MFYYISNASSVSNNKSALAVNTKVHPFECCSIIVVFYVAPVLLGMLVAILL